MSQRLLDTQPNEDLIPIHGQDLLTSDFVPNAWS